MDVRVPSEGADRAGWRFERCFHLIFVSYCRSFVVFWRVRPWTGVILLPYLAWVAFAGALNIAVWRMNLS